MIKTNKYSTSNRNQRIEQGKESDYLKEIVTPLLTWYDNHARILPWRENPTGYRVWVSEIMLQQTRVEAVRPYYKRFMDALPTAKELAEIDEDALLKLWEGLGYYNRVRNLQKAARIIVSDYHGQLPFDYESLLSLPGIGTYTAGAISSIAFGNCQPAVDGNVLRVISRILASDEDIGKQSVKRKVEEYIGCIIPDERPGDFNQALMELGAVVCLPKGVAKCSECPINKICMAYEQGIVMDLPKKAPKKPRQIEEKTILVIKDGDLVAIRKRDEKGLLAGLYEFPNEKGHLSEEEVLKLIVNMSLSPIRIQKLEPSKHIFTHKEWHMIGYVIHVCEPEFSKTRESIDVKDLKPKNDYIFIDVQEVKDNYAIPSAFQAYVNYIGARHL